MPSTSKAQAKLMQAVAHGWKKPGGDGPPVSVAKEFVAADQKKSARRSKGSRNRAERKERKMNTDAWASRTSFAKSGEF